MQVAVIDYARNVAWLSNAHSTEFKEETSDPVIALITEWVDEDGRRQLRDDEADLGGSMRLGAQTSHLVEGSITREAYDSAEVNERHRHRYEVNPDLIEKIENAGLVFVGKDETGQRCEIFELDDHPYYVGVQYHPEFKSRPERPSPPFLGLLKAAAGHDL